MIDFHSHILPGIDDGSSSMAESLQMLRISRQKGVEKMVATPHFYAAKESPEEFLKRRDTSWRLLSSLHKADMPDVYVGAEVYYYTGISRTDDIQKLCIGGTNVLLLEMPFHRWPERMIQEVISLAQGGDLTVLLAHIDRYLDSQKPDIWKLLAANGVLFQVNASFFLDGWKSKRKAFRMLREGKIAVLGSDCHNMKDRKPNLDLACAVIRDKFGEKAVLDITQRSERLLEINDALSRRDA
ncbi:MAG: capsular polysaccharide biosynthesis protein [Clostridiales bacterium]|nr:capsular polysaccharide biosynthesis protein [Clostridiales bacterium]